MLNSINTAASHVLFAADFLLVLINIYKSSASQRPSFGWQLISFPLVPPHFRRPLNPVSPKSLTQFFTGIATALPMPTATVATAAANAVAVAFATDK